MLTTMPDGIGLSDAARRAGLAASTAHRLLQQPEPGSDSTADAATLDGPVAGPLVVALGYVTDGLRPEAWYWPVVELFRKTFFTGLLLFFPSAFGDPQVRRKCSRPRRSWRARGCASKGWPMRDERVRGRVGGSLRQRVPCT